MSGFLPPLLTNRLAGLQRFRILMRRRSASGEGNAVRVTTIADIVRRFAAETPDNLAIEFGDSRMSWRDLDRRSNRCASALQALGIGAQDRIAFLAKNCVEYFEVAFAAAKLNAVVVAVNWRLTPAEIAYIVNDARAPVLIAGHDFFETTASIRKELAHVKHVVAIGSHPGWIAYERWLEQAGDRDPHAPVTQDDVCMQLYTSGTTGLPKGVLTTNVNLFTLLGNAQAAWRFDRSSVNLVCMPLFHIAGCEWALAGMELGAATILVRDFDPAQILDLMQNKSITNVLFVPAMLGFMARVLGAEARQFPALRSIVYGASPITDETLLAAMRTFKCEFVQLYGMTETTGAITELTAADHDPAGPKSYLLRSAGKPFPWVDLRIVDAEGRDCAAGEVGELWTRSAQNMLGYWNKATETGATLTADGWLKTGDAGYIDKDGYVFLTDRVKDMIVSGGENIYPAEIENILAAHPAIAEVAVIGVPDDKWGETVKAVVALKAAAQANAADILAFGRANLAGYKCPTSVDFIAALPRNPSGKVLKKDLRAPYWSGKTRRIN
jgi:long-chain acyl-CoA synthetase